MSASPKQIKEYTRNVKEMSRSLTKSFNGTGTLVKGTADLKLLGPSIDLQDVTLSTISKYTKEHHNIVFKKTWEEMEDYKFARKSMHYHRRNT